MSVHKLKNGKYATRWRQYGRNHSRTFDRAGDANALDREVKRRLALGELYQPPDIRLDLFAETYWREHMPTLAANTDLGYASAWDNHIRDDLGGYELRQITTGLLVTWTATLARRGASTATVRKAVAVLQSILAHAVQKDLIAANPAVGLKIKAPEVQRPLNPLTCQEVEQLRAHLGREIRGEWHPNLAHQTLVTVLAYTGLRPGEALALTWGDVGDQVLHVERAVALGTVKQTKTYRRRDVPLSRPVAADLTQLRVAAGGPHSRQLVFPRPDGQPLADHDWRNLRRRVLKPAAKQAGRPDFKPYDLRATCASIHIAAGLNIVEVARTLGHSVAMCDKHYARLFAAHNPAKRIPVEQQIRQARKHARKVSA